MKGWEEIDHTADLAVRARGQTLSELFESAAEAMFSFIGAADFSCDELRTIDVHVASPTLEELLRSWLGRLLRAFDGEAFYPIRFRVDAQEGACTATVSGGTFDPARHEFRTEIKGVTFHGLRVWREGDLWLAEVVFDV